MPFWKGDRKENFYLNSSLIGFSFFGVESEGINHREIIFFVSVVYGINPRNYVIVSLQLKISLPLFLFFVRHQRMRSLEPRNCSNRC